MAASRTVPVVLLGCGPVGHAVIQRLSACAANLKSAFALDFKVVAVCDSSGAFLTDSTEHADQVCQWRKDENQKFTGHPDYKEIAKEDLIDLVAPTGVAIDCTATDDVTPLLKSVLEVGGAVVMANKRPLTGPIADFKMMLSAGNRKRVGYESTVGAGTPFVAAVRRVIAGGGSIQQIDCTLSGTLGFLTSGLQVGKPLSELVKEAYHSGFTEPDPRDDLSGFDVARKALILSRTIGWDKELSDINVQGLYPPELQDVPVPEFLESISSSCDADISRRNAAAQQSNKVLRYVASVNQEGIEVGLKEVPMDSPIGRLGGTDNIMELSSDTYETPLVVQGAGAGGAITAAGVIADMVETMSM